VRGTATPRHDEPGALIGHARFDERDVEKVKLQADWAFVWRESVEDGIYRPFVGPPIRTGQLSRNPFVGGSPSVTLT
jgi:hypothetical protein